MNYESLNSKRIHESKPLRLATTLNQSEGFVRRSVFVLGAMVIVASVFMLFTGTLLGANETNVCNSFSNSTNATTATCLCPFCSSVNPTIAEQMDSNDAIVVVKLTEQPPEVDDDDLELPKGKFEVTQILKGDEYIRVGTEIETIVIGNHEIGDQFMVMGVDPPSIAWSTPIRTTDQVVEYFQKVPTLPASGVDRLAYFQEFFEDKETVLANDAYDEFALAPYKDVIALKDRMHHDKLVDWIKDKDVMESRKRLYFTMLGVCGTDDDIDFLEEMLAEEDREKRPGLDAMVACYLRIRGPEGLPYIEKLFLSNLEAEYIDVFSVIQALRFHTTETDQISKDRVAKSMRLVLDHPKIADIVIPDLSRLQDWSVMDRLADMYRNAKDQTKWVRTPIASYMFECPKPEAKVLLDEFRKLDADAVNRAELMASFDSIEFDDDDSDDDDSDDDDSEDDDSDDEDDKSNDDNSGSDTVNESENTNSETESKDTDNQLQELPVAVLGAGSDNPTDSSVFVSAENPLGKELSKLPPTTVALKPGPADADSKSANDLVTQNSSAPVSSPVASADLGAHWTVIVGLLFLISAVLFALLWSVINGWFERLIF